MPARQKKQQVKELVSPVEGIKPYVLKKGEKYMNKKQLEHFRADGLALDALRAPQDLHH